MSSFWNTTLKFLSVIIVLLIVCGFYSRIDRTALATFENASILLTTHPDNYFVAPFTTSLRNNGIKFSVAFTSGLDKSTRVWWLIEGQIIGLPHGKSVTFCIDTADDALRIDHECLAKSDLYFKSSLVREFVPRVVLDVELRKRLHPFAIKRGAWFCCDKFIDLGPPRSTVLTSYSGGTSFVVAERGQLYEFLRNAAGNDSALVDLFVTSGSRYDSSRVSFECKSQFTLDCYYQFLRGSYFMLNLQGIGLSQPLRLEDACITQTAVVSEAIFVDAARDFPAYFISCNTHATSKDFALPRNGSTAVIDAGALRDELQNLFANYKSIFRTLLRQQHSWCKRHISDAAFIHQLLKHVSGTPFARKLRIIDAKLYEDVYGI